jgi:hypothetical protein
MLLCYNFKSKSVLSTILDFPVILDRKFSNNNNNNNNNVSTGPGFIYFSIFNDAVSTDSMWPSGIVSIEGFRRRKIH